MTGFPRTLFFILTAFVVLGTAAFVGVRQVASSLHDVEVGVFFPGNSEQSWIDFVEAVRLASREIGAPVEHPPGGHESRVSLEPLPIRFRWYPEIGCRGIQRRVEELCQRAEPPVALVGANSSTLTGAMADSLAECKNPHGPPVLLMTEATTDGLISVNPGRSFRFGYNNSYQAKLIVDRLHAYYQEQGAAHPKLSVLAVAVDDNAFSVDLAERFLKAVRAKFTVDVVPSPQSVSMADGVKEPDYIWRLTTATGSFNDPSPEEWRLTRRIVSAMTMNPVHPWVLALPVNVTTFRRLTFAMSETFKVEPDQSAVQKVRDRLVILAGDSMDYYTFKEATKNEILPVETPAPVILFAHVNPVDTTVSRQPTSAIPSRGLNREVVRALLRVIPKMGMRPTPEKLAAELSEYVPSGKGERLFRDHERHEGGGAIVAAPRKKEFELLLPASWRDGEAEVTVNKK